MKAIFRKLFGGDEGSQRDDEPRRPIVVVSGLPRSGTSMMMKMLEAGGLPVMTDHERTPDADNPEGYYEYERVKQLDKGDTAWVHDAQGKVVKIISALLEHLPNTYVYEVIFMHRDLDEILASQRKMLHRRGETHDPAGDAQMADLFGKHVAKVTGWLDNQPNFRVHDVNYNELLENPRPFVHTINQFLGGELDEAKMAAVVNPDLYRNRSTGEDETAGAPSPDVQETSDER